MKILITGGYGYLGSKIYQSLKNKYIVKRFTKDECNLLNRDEVNALFQNEYFDIIIHTAIAGIKQNTQYDTSLVHTNICMINNLLYNKKSYNYFLNIGSMLQLQQFGLSNNVYCMSKKII